MAVGGFITAGPRKRAILGAQSKFSGMEEAVRFIRWMSTAEKNRAVRKAYVIATKKYLIALKGRTPDNKYPNNPKRSAKKKPLKQTIGFAWSKEHRTGKNLIDPIWVGHLVRKGAYHQHFIVQGTKAWNQGLGAKQRSTGGSKQRKDVFTFKTQSNKWYRGFAKRAVRGKFYVKKVYDSQYAGIENGFADAFVRGMRKEALSPKYKGFLSY